jgi:hypothetical protein
MPVLCWSVFHSAAAPVLHAATRVIRHASGPIVRRVHHAHRVAHAVTSHPYGWFQTVCKFVPAALAGAILAVPQPLPPPVVVPVVMAQPAPFDPGLWPVFPFGSGLSSGLPSMVPSTTLPTVDSGQGSSTPGSPGTVPDTPSWPVKPAPVPEPASDILLLTAMGVLVAVSRRFRGSRKRDTGGR